MSVDYFLVSSSQNINNNYKFQFIYSLFVCVFPFLSLIQFICQGKVFVEKILDFDIYIIFVLALIF